MKARSNFFLATLLVVLVLISVFVFLLNAKKNYVPPAKSVDECKLDASQLSLVCCRGTDNILHLCNDKTDFKPGDYVAVKVNLQKALEISGINTDAYKVCGFSRLTKDLADSGSSETAEFDYSKSLVGCSGLFYSKNFYQGTTAGFIQNTQGKAKIAEWRIYPETTELSVPSNAISNFDKSTAIFSLEVNVGE